MMYAISLWEPWATLVAIGEKRFETRSWRPPQAMVGRQLAIHATKHWPKVYRNLPYEPGPFRDVLVDGDEERGRWLKYDLHPGCIIAVATLEFAVRTEEMDFSDGRPHERAFGNYAPGRFAWCLTDVHRLEKPGPARGRQRLWIVPPTIATKVRTSAVV